MGRPESPLDSDGSALRELAIELRALRQRAGLTYKQLANATMYGTSTLQEAAAGRRLPTLDVTLAIVQACDGDVAAWRGYWRQVRDAASSGEKSAPVYPPRQSPATSPDAGASEPAETSATSGRSPWTRRPCRVWLTVIAAGLALLTGTGVAVALARNSASAPPPAHRAQQDHSAKHPMRTYSEEEYNKNGAATFQFLNGSGPGQPLEFQETVMVSCKIRNTTLLSTIPDGYWYRIASMPWDNKYYAVANTFLNGDPPGGPYTHNTDFSVPNC